MLIVRLASKFLVINSQCLFTQYPNNGATPADVLSDQRSDRCKHSHKILTREDEVNFCLGNVFLLQETIGLCEFHLTAPI